MEFTKTFYAVRCVRLKAFYAARRVRVKLPVVAP
jgi:hypothetical protein